MRWSAVADVEPCAPHGLRSYTDDAGTVHVSTGARCVGPDPDRDKRIDVYRDRERRRAARALDRYVEAVGDYVLTRGQLAALRSAIDYPEDVPGLCRCATDPTAACTPSPLLDEESPSHHNRHYGVPAANPYEGKSIGASIPPAHAEGGHDI